MSDINDLGRNVLQLEREQRAYIERLEAENKILREAVEDTVRYGIRADTNPTVNLADPPGIGWWYDYLKRADKSTRGAAREALRKVAALAEGAPKPTEA